jgi:hypothetical protein
MLPRFIPATYSTDQHGTTTTDQLEVLVLLNEVPVLRPSLHPYCVCGDGDGGVCDVYDASLSASLHLSSFHHPVQHLQIRKSERRLRIRQL